MEEITTITFSGFDGSPVISDGDYLVGILSGLNASILMSDLKVYMRSSLQDSYASSVEGHKGEISLSVGNPLRLISTTSGFVPSAMSTVQFTAIASKYDGEMAWSLDEQRYICNSSLPTPSIEKLAYLSDIPDLPPTISLQNAGIGGKSIIQNGTPDLSGNIFVKGVVAGDDISITEDINNRLVISSTAINSITLQDAYDNGAGNIFLSTPFKLSSTTAGFVPPSMTFAEFAAISPKDDGTVAFNTDSQHLIVKTSTTVQQLAYLSDVPSIPGTPSLQDAYDAGSSGAHGSISLIVGNAFKLSSTSAGFVAPAMTSAQFISISSKNEGEMAYATDSGRHLVHTALGDNALAYISDIPAPIPTASLQQVYDAGTPGSKGALTLSSGNPLKLSSTSAGLVPPAMTAAQFTGISSKNDGEMAWASDVQRYVCHGASPSSDKQIAYTSDIPALQDIQSCWNESDVGNINLTTPGKTFTVRTSLGVPILTVDTSLVTLSVDTSGINLTLSSNLTYGTTVSGTSNVPGDIKKIACSSTVSRGTLLKIDTSSSFTLKSVATLDLSSVPIVAISDVASSAGIISVRGLSVYPVICDSSCVMGQVLKKSSSNVGQVTPGSALLTGGEFCVAMETRATPGTLLAAQILNR